MRALVAAAALSIAVALSPTLASAQVGETALGALSGLVVGGPIGAVVGGVIGYTAGPTMSHAIFRGRKRNHPRPPQ
jgi:hypothetical protein